MNTDLFLDENAIIGFSRMIQARWPEWLPYIQTFDNPIVSEQKSNVLNAEIPSPMEGGPVLILQVNVGEVLVSLGKRGAEKLFVWNDPEERADAFVEIVTFLTDITIAEVLVAWERYRFLWKTWEVAHFERAADITGNRRVTRTEAWPKPVV